MSELISVIVPVYNVEQYLDRCVSSILSQTYSNLEILLVDDGSTDRSGSICDEWVKRDNRITVIHKKNGGLSDARNAGLAVAKGEFIGFVDSDDWIAPRMYELLKNSIDREQSDIAACTVEMVWQDNTPSCLLTEKLNCVLDRQHAQKALLNETLLKQPVWNRLYNKKTVENIPFPIGKYHEDVYWSYQVVGNADKVSIIEYSGYYYMQREESIMGETYSLKRLDVIEAYENRYHYICEEFPEMQIEAKISIIKSCVYHGQMALKYLSRPESEFALKYLNKVKKRYPIQYKDYKELKMTHRLWIDTARFSLKAACRLKNILNVGY